MALPRHLCVRAWRARSRVCLRQPMRVAEFLGLAVGEIRYFTALASAVIRRALPGRWQIVERGQRTIGHGPLNAALNSLMTHPHPPPRREKRGVARKASSIRARSTRLACSAPRPRNRTQRRQIILANRQVDRTPQTRHRLPSLVPNQTERLTVSSRKRNPMHMIGFMELIN